MPAHHQQQQQRAGTSNDLQKAVDAFVQDYLRTTPASLQMIDAYMVFIMASAIAQFVYVIVAGSYPFNAFVAGFGSCVASFVFAANLRMQTNPLNKAVTTVSRERAFADFVFCHVLLHFIVIHFIG
ncbi:oligosaccharyltransferase complex subunit epsilon [Sorochytrium milnesiophthora]